MNHHTAAIANRLSLRPPQRESLERMGLTADDADDRRLENREKKAREFGKRNTNMHEPMLFTLGEETSK